MPSFQLRRRRAVHLPEPTVVAGSFSRDDMESLKRSNAQLKVTSYAFQHPIVHLAHSFARRNLSAITKCLSVRGRLLRKSGCAARMCCCRLRRLKPKDRLCSRISHVSFTSALNHEYIVSCVVVVLCFRVPSAN